VLVNEDEKDARLLAHRLREVAALLSRACDLLERIEAREQTASAAPGVRAGSIRLDVAKRCAWRDGIPIELTAKEYDLLLLLARNPGKVFSRSDLLKEVWGYRHQGYRHTIDTHVSRLRRKIEQDPARPALIKTVWGIGYRLSDGDGA
jgi:DNA-binding response OmpR family regulator